MKPQTPRAFPGREQQHRDRPASFSSQGWGLVISVVAGTVNGLTTAQTISLAAPLPFCYRSPSRHSRRSTLLRTTTRSASPPIMPRRPGNLDGGGYSYSADAAGGAVINWQGVPFVARTADQNDVVQAAGQTIPSIRRRHIAAARDGHGRARGAERDVHAALHRRYKLGGDSGIQRLGLPRGEPRRVRGRDDGLSQRQPE